MIPKEPYIDLSTLDFNNVISDREAINQCNEQRFEMQQLDGVVYENEEAGIAVGYKDITNNEFWVRGHIPGAPLMPGVMMCESAAQLCSYFAEKLGITDEEHILGFAGIDEVRFRGIVVPGDRLIIMVKRVKMNRLLLSCHFQCFVKDQLVCHGAIKGAPLEKKLIGKR